MGIDDRSVFAASVAAEIAAQGVDPAVLEATRTWMLVTQPYKYSYHFSWLGLPIIQYPPDIVAVQDLIWKVKPDLVIETGVARGGSLLLSASTLALIELAEAKNKKTSLNPALPRRRVLGIDIDIRAHNRSALEQHPLASWITMIEGSSVSTRTVSEVRRIAEQHETVMVLLDSNHTHEHVLAELNAYAPLVSPQSYCVVFDTIIEDMPGEMYPDRSWGPGNSPMTAVSDFLLNHSQFEVDREIDARLLISVARGGYLRRRSDSTEDSNF